MLFNSYLFLLIFLPITYVGYQFLRHRHYELSLLWLTLCSLFFYGWWNPAYLLLITGSILGNFFLSKQIIIHRHSQTGKFLLILGVAANLTCLGYFKYTDFLLTNLNYLLGTGFKDAGIILPLAISFFTFQQIAFLVDCRQGKASEYQFSHYCLFVTFFPQLLAGPIVHHSEMMPQFEAQRNAPRHNPYIPMAVTIISLGLFKKVIIADTFQDYANQIFTLAEQGKSISFFDAWAGTLSYTLQIYFDFSAYCDIAYGLALLFGIRLPQNFASPYKAGSIVEFWNRWHMTLSRFLKDYVYIPFGGNRKGNIKRYRNLMLTMLLGGLWHGAGWTFVLWGALHGLYLSINHGWKALKLIPESPASKVCSIFLTYLMVAFAWVLFRAEDLQSAQLIYAGLFDVSNMFSDTTIRQPVINDLLRQLSLTLPREIPILGVLILFHIWIWYLPNLQQIMQKAPLGQASKEQVPQDQSPKDQVPQNKGMCIAQYPAPQTGRTLFWSPSLKWLLLSAFCLATSLLSMHGTGEFIYFQF